MINYISKYLSTQLVSTEDGGPLRLVIKRTLWTAVVLINLTFIHNNYCKEWFCKETCISPPAEKCIVATYCYNTTNNNVSNSTAGAVQVEANLQEQVNDHLHFRN